MTASSGPTAEDQRRFRVLVDANVVGVTVSDAERVLEANDAWLRMTGHTRAELEGGAISWRAMTPREWTSGDDRVLAQLAAEGWVEPYEKEYLRPDGTRVPVLISGVRLDSDPLRIVALVIDQSDRRAAERERELLLVREREARREAELSADRTRRLQRATAALSAASSHAEVGDVVVSHAIEAFRADAGALAFVEGDEMVVASDWGFEGEVMEPWRRFPLDMDTPTGDAVRTGEAVYLANLDDWEHYPELRGQIEGRYAAMAAVPFSGAADGALLLCLTHEHQFVAADRSFLAALADQAAHALERARLYEERAYVARTLQTGLLPDRLADIPGLELAVRYHSIADGGAVGGDFYDCFDISPGRWLVAVGDVAGKGTAAAVLTGLARHTLRAIALREERPEEMLRFLNEALRRQSSASAFCTVGCATLAPDEGGGFDARLAAGGHPFPLLLRAGAGACAQEVVARGMLLGVEPDPMLTPVDLKLRPGDTLVLYTDGVVDARATNGDHFGEDRLRAAVDAAAGGSAQAVATAIDEAVAAFEPDRQRDDRAIVVLRVRD